MGQWKTAGTRQKTKDRKTERPKDRKTERPKDRKTTVLTFESIFIAKLKLLNKIHSEGKLY